MQRIDDRLKITVQLIDATNDRHLWSSGFEGRMDDVLALQDDVARAVARKMEQTVSRQLIQQEAIVKPSSAPVRANHD